MKPHYRKLTVDEIAILTGNGCRCDLWDGVEVAAEGFDAGLISECRFAGMVRIGAEVTINGVRDSISNYEIGDNVSICNVESLRTTGQSLFGNGTKVNVLNEAGGRTVRLFEGLTAQIAYIYAMYRHRPETITAIEDIIDILLSRKTSTLGYIGSGTRINNCGTLTNLRTGEGAILDGAEEITECTVASTREAPSYIGRGVIMRDSVTATSAEITDRAIVEKCFIGQGCIIGKGFLAESSLFFANSVCLAGEACSIFAGPYTVTHHKSTLLIGGMFSFYNAGSGSNQSNHYYRLGPVHQGVLERGAKTASSSYMLFPARIGAFSIVKGRHNSNIDTSELPFSYIVENSGNSVVIPAANIAGVGSARDEAKWPGRDMRKGTQFDDLIRFDMLNPYTVGKIARGKELLEELAGASRKDFVPYRNFFVKNSSIKKGIALYRLALEKYAGGYVARKLASTKWKSLSDLAEIIDIGIRANYANWADVAGMIVPVAMVEMVLDKVESKEYSSVEEISAAFATLHRDYDEFEWVYVIRLISSHLDKAPANITAKDVVAILERWKRSVRELNDRIKEDAAKEFSDNVMTSYGIDGDRDTAIADFKNVRGEFSKNTFLNELDAESCKAERTADKLIEAVKKLK